MNFFLHIVAIIAMGAPNILGFNMLFGRGKIFHFGPLGVSIVAAYTTFLITMATGSYLIGILSGLVTTLLVSSFFAWLSLRLDTDGFGVMSIAVHLGLLAVVLNWSSVTRGALGIPRVPRFSFLDSTLDFALFSTVVAAVWMYILWRIDQGPFGRKLIAL